MSIKEDFNLWLYEVIPKIFLWIVDTTKFSQLIIMEQSKFSKNYQGSIKTNT